MKTKILFILYSFAFGTVFAQYSMDLSMVSSSAIRYLQMGNAGPAGEEIRVNNLYMEKGGVPVLPVMGKCIITVWTQDIGGMSY